MWFSLSEQTLYFLYSIVLGLILGVVYDFTRLIRSGTNRFLRIFFADILFFSVSAFLTVLYSLPFNDGTVRAFIFFGEIVGFLIFRLTAGEITSKIYPKIIFLFQKFTRAVEKFLIYFFNLVLKILTAVVYNVVEIVDAPQNIVLFSNKGKNYERKKAKSTKAEKRPKKSREKIK
ncbi:MAG: spore cortex biosynthesis protein YabQ [Oscillospiraceae bacterium]|nr:spore cortex biosynthesis protein YabQ [Candidatus Ruminococcus equi]